MACGSNYAFVLATTKFKEKKVIKKGQKLNSKISVKSLMNLG